MRKIGILLVFFMFFIFLSACSTTKAQPVTRVRDDLLGTVITLTLYDHAQDAVFEDIFGRIQDIDFKMTARNGDSEIAAISAAAGSHTVSVSPETWALLQTALDIASLSDGAFDPTVAPLTKLWNIGTPEARLPSPEEIATALPLVDYHDVLLAVDGGVGLNVAGMGLDLGAIAKGYAGDEALRLTREADVEHALLNLGGNIVVCGGNPDGSPWRVGLKIPEPGAEGYFGVITLDDGAVVTSGAYERYFEQDGIRWHHIFDPKTGYPADSGLLSVTVIYENSTWADGLSTACFVLGLRRGFALLSGIEGAEGVFVADGNMVYTTPGLLESFRLTDPAYERRAYP